MVIEGFVYDKIKVSESVTQIVMKKKQKMFYVNIAFVGFGFINNEIEKLDIQKKDRIKITYFLKSKKWNEKYSTDAVIEKIELKERRTAQTSINYETGEIFND